MEGFYCNSNISAISTVSTISAVSPCPTSALFSPFSRIVSLHYLVCLPSTKASVLALMSPVHRSSSNVDAASNIAIAASVMAQEGFSEGDEDLDDTGIQRSASMPPAMFDDDDSNRATRNRERSGICIQRRGSRHRQRIVLESRSEDELTTSGGGGKDGDSQEWDGSKGEDVGTESYPRGRRNAFRGGLRVVRRATCAADGSYNTSRNTGTERPEYVTQPQSTHSSPIASPVFVSHGYPTHRHPVVACSSP